MAEKIYTHDEATRLIEILEDILSDNNIKVPSPEDDEREPDNGAALYGSVYSDLMDDTEYTLIEMLDAVKGDPSESEKIDVTGIAKEIVGLYEDMLSRYKIVVPSPEDEGRKNSGDKSSLYGSVYNKLISDTEGVLNELISRAPAGYVPYEYSGTY